MSGTVSLTCTGAPKGATCALPSTLNINGTSPVTFNVNVNTASRTMAAVEMSRVWLFAMAFLGLIVVTWSRLKQEKAKRYRPLTMLMAAALVLPSCGRGSSNNGSQQNPNETPAGTYNLTVTATIGPNAQSTSLTLTVQ
jgi:hypothetical protein